MSWALEAALAIAVVGICYSLVCSRSVAMSVVRNRKVAGIGGTAASRWFRSLDLPERPVLITAGLSLVAVCWGFGFAAAIGYAVGMGGYVLSGSLLSCVGGGHSQTQGRDPEEPPTEAGILIPSLALVMVAGAILMGRAFNLSPASLNCGLLGLAGGSLLVTACRRLGRVPIARRGDLLVCVCATAIGLLLAVASGDPRFLALTGLVVITVLASYIIITLLASVGQRVFARTQRGHSDSGGYPTMITALVFAVFLTSEFINPIAVPIEVPLLIAGVGILASLAGHRTLRYTRSLKRYVRNYQRAAQRPELVSWLSAGVVFSFSLMLMPPIFEQSVGHPISPQRLGILCATGFLLVAVTAVSVMHFWRKAANGQTASSLNGILPLTFSPVSLAAAVAWVALPYFLPILGAAIGFSIEAHCDTPGRCGVIGASIVMLSLIAASGSALVIYGRPETLEEASSRSTENQPCQPLEQTTSLPVTRGPCGAMLTTSTIACAIFVTGVVLVYYVRTVHDMEARSLEFDLSQPKILLGLIIGGTIPYFLAALCLVGMVVAARCMINEIQTRYRMLSRSRVNRSR